MISHRYKVIILDFDGVLVESNDIKDKAFQAVFADYPDYLEQILLYHHSVTAIRFEKFRYVYECILHLPYNAQIEEKLGKEFSDFCVAQVSVCSEVLGAKALLEYFYRRVPMYLVTINPKSDLDVILAKRGLRQYFKGVYPVTGSKKNAIEDIVKIEGVACNEVVFIGDSQGDANGAKAAGVDFIGRRSEMPLNVPLIFDDMQKILHYLI